MPPSADLVAGLALAALAFVVYWLSNRLFDAGRGDLFYLADAFLHGRTWIDVQLGPYDVIEIGGRFYVPFPPFPAVLFMPIVAVVGAVTADQWESGINAGLAAFDVLLAWWVAGRFGVARPADRLALVLLLGFGTQVWWVTTRGGVWHTGHLVAILLTLLLLAELAGRRRPILLGLLVGAAFLTRPPLAFAGPLVMLWLVRDRDAILARGRAFATRTAALATRTPALPWRAWTRLLAGTLPAVAFFLWYNAVRFGSPLESGYALASLPPFLEAQRARGLFSLAHVPMNLDYLLLHVPALIREPPFFRPDGLGMSVLITSPGLLLAARAPWRDARSWLLLGAAAAVLVPTLLYYGGGWLQYGYRYFLDSIPFVWALAALGIARRGPVPRWGWALIVFGVVVNAVGVYWAYNL